MAADQDTIVEPGAVILVVDDSRVMRQALKKILSTVYPVAEAGDGEEGWRRILDDTSVACVYTDLSMPRLDGYGLIRRIRESADPRVREIPIVLITGNEDSEGTRQRAMSAGANSVVQKPFNSGDILAVARRHVESRRSRPMVDSAAPVASSSAEVSGLKNRISELEATLLEVRGQLQTWQEEARRAEASSLSASAEWEETLNTVRTQLREAHGERDRLRKEHDRLRTELILRQQSVDEKRVSDRMRELENQLAAERSDLSRIRDEARELDALLEAERSANREATARANDLETRVQQLLTEQGNTRAESSRLRRELESARAERDALEATLGLERGKVAEFQDRVRELEADLSQWSHRLADTEQELSEWQARAREAEASLEQADDHLGKADDLERLTRELETERERLEVERERAVAAEQALALERERLHELETGLADLQDAMSAERDRERSRAEAAEHSLASLREAYEAMQSEMPDAEIIESLRVRAETAELNQLQAEDELLETTRRMERSEQARTVAESELRALMHELADARRQLRERTASSEPAPAEQAEAGLDPEVEDEQEAALQPVHARPEEGLEAKDDERHKLDELPAVTEEIVMSSRDELPAEPAESGRGYGRDPLIRQWEAERRRQRRIQVIILAAVAAVAAVGLFFLLG